MARDDADLFTPPSSAPPLPPPPHTHLIEAIQHDVEPLQPGVVLVVLQRHVERDLRDMEAHAVQVARLTDDQDEVTVEVHQDGA